MTFYLLSVTDTLSKDAVLVTNAITISCQTKSGHRVQETSSKATKTTISQAGIFFHLFQFFNVQTQLKDKDIKLAHLYLSTQLLYPTWYMASSQALWIPKFTVVFVKVRPI